MATVSQPDLVGIGQICSNRQRTSTINLDFVWSEHFERVFMTSLN